MSVTILTPAQSTFPAALRHLYKVPAQLYVENAEQLTDLLKRPIVAVVGSRKVSPYGRFVTQKITTELARRGVVIVSGLALGVDGLAHQAALDAGGKTIAVLPSSLEKVYPATHYQLAKRIIKENSVLLTEYAPGSEVYKHSFLERNRLIAGLAQAILIPEAAERSGSLNTASHALEQGKLVMAVPGNINSELSAGTNNLIKAGATPVTGANDVLSALGLEDLINHQQEIIASSQHELIVLALLKDGISDSTTLHAHSGLDITAFNQVLTMLEISGQIRPLGLGRWALG